MLHPDRHLANLCRPNYRARADHSLPPEFSALKIFHAVCQKDSSQFGHFPLRSIPLFFQFVKNYSALDAVRLLPPTCFLNLGVVANEMLMSAIGWCFL